MPQNSYFSKKWHHNFGNYATSDNTECEKATRGYVWGLRSWLGYRTMSPFVLIDRHDLKEGNEYIYRVLKTIKKIFRAPKLPPRHFFKHLFFEQNTVVFVKTLWKYKGIMWKLEKSTGSYVWDLKFWLGRYMMLPFALLDRYDLKETWKRK